MKRKLEDYNIHIGELKKGKKNSITDVRGVKVGHVTYDNFGYKSGVTAIVPHLGNIFKEKLIAASHVINGYGKTVGTVQIDEMGTLETPILLTNTLAVGQVSTALIKYMLRDNKDIGVTTSTINPVVAECNDGYLNKIQDIYIKEEDVYKALNEASDNFLEGSVGAGTGMVCYGLKGGIGSSSRVVELVDKEYCIGVLTLTNFGRMEDLRVGLRPIGRKIKDNLSSSYDREDSGSIIIILATDAPLSHRQLKRLIKRTTHGIAATGAFTSSGSGEIAIGFSTANKIDHYSKDASSTIEVINENYINDMFKAVKEATEEAIISSLINADTKIGRDGNKIYSLLEYEKYLKED